MPTVTFVDIQEFHGTGVLCKLASSQYCLSSFVEILDLYGFVTKLSALSIPCSPLSVHLILYPFSVSAYMHVYVVILIGLSLSEPHINEKSV